MSATILRTVRRATLLLIASFVLIGLAGCSSTPNAADGVKSLTVEVNRHGSIVFNGYPVKPSRLANTLKRAGATSRTAIKISLPEQASPSIATELTEKLVSEGLPRVIFSTPRKATAEPTSGR